MIGSIIFVKTSSPISWIIRKLSRSKYSHCAISVTYDNSYIIEADSFKRVKIRFNSYKEFEVADIDITDNQRILLLDYLIRQKNIEYDYFQIIGFLLRLLKLSKKENLFNTKKIQCAELVDLAYYSIGIDLLPLMQNGDVMPSDLANVLLKQK